MRRMPLVSLMLLFLAPSAYAACSLNLTATNPNIKGQYTLSWSAVPGANMYLLEESNDFFNNLRAEPISGTDALFSIPFNHHSMHDRPFQYRVTAQNDRDASFVPCSGQAFVTVPGDPSLKRLLSRSFVAVAGSAPGANGALFKTYLKLTPGPTPMSGRLIFHRSGDVARDSDPSISYNFTESGQKLEFDDVVAAMGTSGVGMIDIVPDEGTAEYLPRAEVRAYNDTAKGTFGGFFRDVLAGDWYRINSTDSFVVPSARFRANVGFRLLSASPVRVMLSDAEGHALALRIVDYPEGYFTLQSIDALLGMHAEPGQTFVIGTTNGHMFAFHTFTENATNDPEVLVLDNRISGPHLSDYTE